MPKKYLIYVHDDERFDKLTGRGEKSGLVNQLLEKHWSVQPAKKPISPKNPASHPTPDVAGTIPGKKTIKKPEDVTKVVAKIAPKADDVCRHGAAPGFCKYAKCPNSKRA